MKTSTKIIIAIAVAIVVAPVASLVYMQLVISTRHLQSGSSNAAAFDPQYEAAAESYLQNLGMEKFMSKEFGFSAMMPKQNTPVTMDIGTTFNGEINGHSIVIIVKNLPPSDPDYDAGLPLGSWKAHFMIGLSRTKDISNLEIPRNVKDKNGNVGFEYSFTMEKGGGNPYHVQGYTFKKGHRIYILQIAALIPKWDKGFASRDLATFALE